MTDGRKEKIKLRANYLNSIAVAVFAVGAGTPFFTSVNRGGITGGEVFLAALATIFSVSLHVIASHYILEIDL